MTKSASKFLSTLTGCCALAILTSCAGVDEAAHTPVLAGKNSPVSAEIVNADAVYPGYIFWHQSDEIGNDVENETHLTDWKGNLVHTWPTELTGGGTPAYLLQDGKVLRTGMRDIAYSRMGPVASNDTLQIVNADGSIAWEVNAKDHGDFYFHHDIEPMPNGNIIASTYHPVPREDALSLGWDIGDADRVWSDGVVEFKPNFETGEAEIVWAWNFKDHLVQDRHPERANYGKIAEHPTRIDPNYPKNYAPMDVVRQHINSVEYNEALDQVLLSSFIYNEIWIVDHSTTLEEAKTGAGGRSGIGGDLLFRYGNPQSYGMGDTDDRIFLKQHDANWVDEGLPGAGNILVHNNNTTFKPRSGAGPRASGGAPASSAPEALGAAMERFEFEGDTNIYELRLPVTANGTYSRSPDKPFQAETVWFWNSPDYFADFQGGARRLANGSTLLTDTTDNLVVEVDKSGTVVAQYKGATPVYKAFKYTGKDVDFLKAK